MFNTDHLLAATDFSQFSRAALARAISCAEMLGADLTVAHVIDRLESDATAHPFEIHRNVDDILELRRRSDQHLNELIEPWRVRTGVSLHGLTLAGEAYIEIIRAVQAVHAGMVFAGHRGLTGLRRLLVGSTAERLARHCPVPVWVVRNETDRPLKRILVATDFSEASSAALQVAAHLAQRSNAELDLLHVYDTLALADRAPPGVLISEDPRDELREIAEKNLDELMRIHCSAIHAKVHRVARGLPWEVIRKQARRGSVDLIVLGSIGRSGVAGMLMGNTAEKVLRLVDRDVLVVKPATFVSPIEPAAIAAGESGLGWWKGTVL
jgi:nucleotide-binding universal stress UspA family protein